MKKIQFKNVYKLLYSRKILGLTYLALIPGFACVYSFFMPNDFYHTTIEYEKETVLLKTKTEDILKNIFRSGVLLNTSDSNTIDPDGTVHFTVYEKVGTERLTGPAFFDLNKLEFNIRSVDDDQLHFWINFPFGRYNRPTPNKPENCCYVDAMPGVGNYRVPTADCITSSNLIFSGRLTMVCRPLDRNISRERDELGSLPRWFDSLFLLMGLDGIPTNYEAYTLGEVSEKDKDQLAAYIKAHSGMNEKLDGHFIRMLYFSAVTVTTLGYGDIVPITNRARVAIAIESIIGLIIIGLFVSTLSKRE
ncbi:MAG: two pore domain potassium channel family protein [Desulfobulbaceae bacterium]|nr:two pore domain potassium channel family protein [Desulfobulbaceae bacterium]